MKPLFTQSKNGDGIELRSNYILEDDMLKRRLFLGLLFLVICWGYVVVFFSFTKTPQSFAVALQTTSLPTATSTPIVQPFLSHIFYGEEEVWNVFDHDLPDGDVELSVLHYDGVEYEPPILAGYGYTGHEGIDYSLVYEPVLAAGDGVVGYAGRNNPANHRSGYGLYVTINHGGYRTIYGHLSALTVQG